MKTQEELMQLRYKVIADWPKSRYNVGDIIPVTEISDWYYYYHDPAISNTMIDKYPHLFKKLDWWEDLEPDDMPEYVKVNMKRTVLPYGDIIHVETWESVNYIDNNGSNATDFYCTIAGYKYHVGNVLPATQSEYDQQNSLK